MEWPYTTGIMWTLALVLIGFHVSEQLIPYMAIAVIGVHLGIVLIPKRRIENATHAQAIRDDARYSSAASDIHDRGTTPEKLGRDKVSRVRVG